MSEPELSLTEEVLALVALAELGITTNKICKQLRKTPQELGDTFEELADSNQIGGFAGLWFTPENFGTSTDKFLETLQKLHESHPQTESHPRERICHLAGLPWAGKPLDRILSYLQEEELVKTDGTQVRLAEFKVSLTPRKEEFLNRVIPVIEQEPVNVVGLREICEAVKAPKQAVSEILRLGVSSGRLIEIAEYLYYTPAQLEQIAATLSAKFQDEPFTITDAKEALNTSRKYIAPILDHIHAQGLTTRDDDTHQFKSGTPS